MRRDLWVGALGSILFSASFGLLAYLAFGWVQGHRPLYEDLYGPVVFVATPILHGMAIGVLTQLWAPQPWRVTAKATWISVGVLLVLVLVTAMEGIVCVLMATPLVLPLMFAGTWLGWRARQGSRWAGTSLPTVGVLALTIGGGSILPSPGANGEVTTTWWVGAPPQRVWPSVLSIETLPEPDWWLFRLGVAYPVRTRTEPDGRRMCLLSTGAMPEIVTAREEGRRLEFRVLSTPPSMRELNPFGEVHAPHLARAFRSHTGGFLLKPERGGTRIVARSAYSLRMGPAWYWKLWSDAIVRHVHGRVIAEIEKRAMRPEGEDGMPAASLRKH